jgi:hypothetical protein
MTERRMPGYRRLSTGFGSDKTDYDDFDDNTFCPI